MKKFSWTWIVIGLLILGVIYYLIVSIDYRTNTSPQVCNGKKCFTVELARTQVEQEQGLMNRTSMGENSGMIFIFPQSNMYNFRMKNTLIPLDMLRIDDTNKVVRILTAQPCIADPCTLYRPETFAKYVLEINAGIAEKYKIHEGSMMKFRNISSPTK